MKQIRNVFVTMFFLLLCTLISCRSGMIREVDSIHEIYKGKIDQKNIFVSKDFEKIMPVTVAILPFENLSREKEAGGIFRKLFYNNFSSLAYSDIELSTVDQVISGFSPKNIFKTVAPRKIGETLKADAIIAGKVTKFESLYAGVYSQITVGAELKMYDSESGEVLWSLTHKETSRSGSVPTSIVGAILAAATTALDLTKYNFVATANHFCQLAVGTIPSSTTKARKGKALPRITTMAHDGMKKVLKKGDRLQVGIEGNPGLSADFVILPGKTPYHMEEKAPGSYIGLYVVREGDAVKDGIIVVKLYDKWGNTSTWEDTLGYVNVDGNIPPSVTGLKITPGDKIVRIKWNPSEAKDVVKYHIWKSETPLSGYSEIGQTEFASFKDNKVINRTAYFYRITASDKAGNMSPPLPGLSATPISPGPTIITGKLEDDSLWLPGANPYVLKGEVIVPKNVELIVGPGVIVKGSPNSRLVVQGLLAVNGETGSPVMFESLNKNALWSGIVLNRSSEMSRLCNFDVSRAKFGIQILNSSPEIVNGTVTKCATGVQVTGNNSFPHMDDLTIYQNRENGIEIFDMANPRISRCRIAYNNKAGIKIERSQARIQLNEISFNQDGITLNSAAPAIKGNILLNNRRSALIAADISKQALGLGLNYFGYPDNVKVFSSDSKEEGETIRVMAEKREDSTYKDIRIHPYPETLPEEFKSILIVTFSGEIAADALLATSSKEKPSSVKEEEPSDSSLSAYIKAVSAIREKRYKKAIPLLEQARIEKSRAASSSFWLGVCYLETGEVETAIQNYQTASALEPDNVNYLLHLGVALHISGRKADAEKIYREVLKREPGNTQAKKFLAVLMETSNNRNRVK